MIRNQKDTYHWLPVGPERGQKPGFSFFLLKCKLSTQSVRLVHNSWSRFNTKTYKCKSHFIYVYIHCINNIKSLLNYWFTFSPFIKIKGLKKTERNKAVWSSLTFPSRICSRLRSLRLLCLTVSRLFPACFFTPLLCKQSLCAPPSHFSYHTSQPSSLISRH